MNKEEKNLISKISYAFKYAESKIELIKQLRSGTDLGLKEAKDAIDSVWNDRTFASVHDKESAMIELFRDFGVLSKHSLTKEQFMGMLEEAIDNSDTYEADPLDAVLFLCNNIKKKGGLGMIAEEIDKFADSL